jgi:hypothetical protein
MPIELKACPCCKGEARYMGVRYEGAWSDPEKRGVVVICPKCGMRTQLCRSREEVTALWNRRDGDAELATLNEAQAETIQELARQLTQLREDSERYRARANELLAQRDHEEWGKSWKLRRELEEVIGTSDFEEAVRRVKAWKEVASRAETD